MTAENAHTGIRRAHTRIFVTPEQLRPARHSSLTSEGTCASLGFVHALHRAGHPDMVVDMDNHHTPLERAAYGLGILFGWFWRTHCPQAES